MSVENPPGTAPHADERLLNEKQLARRWNVSVKKLQADRPAGKGPSFHRFGRAIRYRIADIEAYERKHLVLTEIDNEKPIDDPKVN